MLDIPKTEKPERLSVNLRSSAYGFSHFSLLTFHILSVHSIDLTWRLNNWIVPTLSDFHKGSLP